MKIRRKLWSWLIGVVLALSVAAAGANAWVEGQYAHQAEAAAALVSSADVTVAQTEETIAFIPAEPRAGFIFYPGGLVPAEAYAPLLRMLAEEGVLCVAVHMPFRLAVLDMGAAKGIADSYPDITRWAIGGHSLGGAMAANYAAGHPEAFDALVLLAAYATAVIPADMSVVSIYGDRDGVMQRDKYAQYRSNLPDSTAEVILPGGNHAQFGDYGEQKGDGAAEISAQAQWDKTVQALLPVLLGE